jgi:hypothetical protein
MTKQSEDEARPKLSVTSEQDDNSPASLNVLDEYNDLAKLLSLDSQETRKIAQLKQSTKVAEGIQSSIREEMRQKIGIVRSKLRTRITQLAIDVRTCEAEVKQKRDQLNWEERAVVLAREKVKKDESKVAEKGQEHQDKKQLHMLMKRFEEGEEMGETDMEKILEECKAWL